MVHLNAIEKQVVNDPSLVLFYPQKKKKVVNKHEQKTQFKLLSTSPIQFYELMQPK
jgi:hypothetical protein